MQEDYPRCGPENSPQRDSCDTRRQISDWSVVTNSGGWSPWRAGLDTPYTIEVFLDTSYALVLGRNPDSLHKARSTAVATGGGQQRALADYMSDEQRSPAARCLRSGVEIEAGRRRELFVTNHGVPDTRGRGPGTKPR